MLVQKAADLSLTPLSSTGCRKYIVIQIIYRVHIMLPESIAIYAARGGPTGSKVHKLNDHMPMKSYGNQTRGFITAVALSFHHSDQFFGFTRQYANKQCTVSLMYKQR